MKVISRAPGKLILFGEHFVVYDKTAIVMAIDRYVYSTISLRKDKDIHINSETLGVEGVFSNGKYRPRKGGMEGKEKLQPLMKCINAVLAIYGKRVGLNIQISSDIPVAAGLGSSAATAVSLAAGLSELLELGLSKEVINRLAYESEVMIHYTPSGVDNTISTYGGLLRYNKGWKNKIRRLRIKYDIPLLIADTGRPRNTGVQVSIVRSIYNNFPKLFLEILRVYDKIYRNAINAIKKRDLKELGLLMNINQGLLSAVGVSSIELDILVNIALDRGAYGAKLTGAGGGGCMITLVDKDRAHDLEKSISKYCKEVLFVSTDNKGVTAKIVK